jgi:tetratricopeptide (TPR) repeat protein
MVGLLATAHSRLGNTARAETLTRDESQLMNLMLSLSSTGNLGSPLTTVALMLRSFVNDGRYADAERLLPQALEVYRRVASQKDAQTAVARSILSSVGVFYIAKGKSRQGMQLLRNIVEILRFALGDEDPDTLTAIESFASIHINNNVDDAFDDAFGDAERFLSEMAEIQRGVLGPNSDASWRTVWMLSDVFWRHGKSEQAHGRSVEAKRYYDKAEQLTRQVLDFYRTQPPNGTGLPGGIYSGGNMLRLAGILAIQERYAEAEEEYKTVLGWLRRGPNAERNIETPILLDTRALGWVQLHEQKYVDAEATLREACNGLAIPGNGFSESQQRYACESELGASLVGQKKYAEAEPLLLNGYDGLIRTQREEEKMFYFRVLPRLTPPETAVYIARMYEEWGKPQQASEWRQRAEGIK